MELLLRGVNVQLGVPEAVQALIYISIKKEPVSAYVSEAVHLSEAL
jgi:hypothetical protein